MKATTSSFAITSQSPSLARTTKRGCRVRGFAASDEFAFVRKSQLLESFKSRRVMSGYGIRRCCNW
jgi:hypothetical protein